MLHSRLLGKKRFMEDMMLDWRLLSRQAPTHKTKSEKEKKKRSRLTNNNNDEEDLQSTTIMTS